LLAANESGRVLWCTPQATRLLQQAVPHFDAETFVLSEDVQHWLQSRAAGQAAAGGDLIPLDSSSPEQSLRLSYVGRIGGGEILLRLVDDATTRQEIVLKKELALTLREAEVLTWIARGKSNRDIAEILGLSPRTVNKHLEQIYTKLGVENRTAAAALAMRTLGAG
jgi:DNA-binding CsgD family transcriptional regulator